MPFLQVDSSMDRLVWPSQLPALQTVPDGYFWQAREPLHLPLAAHEAGPPFLQKPRGSVTVSSSPARLYP